MNQEYQAIPDWIEFWQNDIYSHSDGVDNDYSLLIRDPTNQTFIEEIKQKGGTAYTMNF